MGGLHTGNRQRSCFGMRDKLHEKRVIGCCNGSPVATPASARMPGMVGRLSSKTVPVAGKKSLAASSAYIRHSSGCPCEERSVEKMQTFTLRDPNLPLH